MRKATRCSYTNAKKPYLLTGLLYCTECGCKFSGNTRKNKQKGLEYTTYRCCGRTNKRTCKTKEIRCEYLDKWVIEQFFMHFFNPEIIPVITAKLNEQILILAKEDDSYKEAVMNLKVLEKSRDNLIEAIVQTGVNEAISRKIKEFEKQIADCKEYIETCESQTVVRTITEQEVMEKIQLLKSEMENPENLARTKYLLTEYIDRIEISNETVKVTFKVTFFICEDENLSPTYYYEKRIRRYELAERYDNKIMQFSLIPWGAMQFLNS